MNWLLVFVGGGLGSLMRFGMIRATNYCFHSMQFPLATFLSNLASCLLFSSTLLFLLPKIKDSASLQLFLITGICGGFSTFSTFSFETYQLVNRQQYGLAIANVLISLMACLLVFYIFIKRLK